MRIRARPGVALRAPDCLPTPVPSLPAVPLYCLLDWQQPLAVLLADCPPSDSQMSECSPAPAILCPGGPWRTLAETLHHVTLTLQLSWP